VTYICCAHRGDFCEWCDCDFASANSICKHSRVLLFHVQISITRVLRKVKWVDSGEEIIKRWRCFEKINHLRDSWLVLRSDGLQTAFSCLCSAILESAVSFMPISPSWVVSFFLEKHYIPQYCHWLTIYVGAFSSQFWGKVVAILGVIKPCTCGYARTLRFWYPKVAHILPHSVNLVFGTKSGFKNKYRARVGLQN